MGEKDLDNGPNGKRNLAREEGTLRGDVFCFHSTLGEAVLPDAEACGDLEGMSK